MNFDISQIQYLYLSLFDNKKATNNIIAIITVAFFRRWEISLFSAFSIEMSKYT